MPRPRAAAPAAPGLTCQVHASHEDDPQAHAARDTVKTPPILLKKTQAVIERIQKKVDGTFFSYWTSTSGSVCDNDVLAMHAILKAAGPQERIALLVKSDGGSGMASLRLVHLLRRYAKKLTVIAPLNCASAATMLALGRGHHPDGAALRT